MNRIIKYRAWDEIFNAMRYSHAVGLGNAEQKFDSGLIGAKEGAGLDAFAGRWITEKDFVYFPLMQYTGLKDKEGIEIYEGDICNCRMVGIDTHIELVTTQVYWYKSVAGFGHKVISSDSEYTSFGLSSENLLRCEIIGNIHQNAELLKQEGK